MTDSLVRKEMFGQEMRKGFMPDVHCPTGAPRESIVKITKAEPGGLDAKGLWRPAALGVRPRYESKEMKAYLAGEFVEGVPAAGSRDIEKLGSGAGSKDTEKPGSGSGAFTFTGSGTGKKEG
jgi:hypothetical protein